MTTPNLPERLALESNHNNQTVLIDESDASDLALFMAEDRAYEERVASAIVARYNAHAALVAERDALRSARDRLREALAFYASDPDEAFDHARAALKGGG